MYARHVYTVVKGIAVDRVDMGDKFQPAVLVLIAEL